MYTLKDCFRMSVNLYDLNLKYKKTYESLNQNIESLFSKSDFILGKKVVELEKKISNFSNSKYVSCVGNGTDALIFSLEYLKRKFPNKKNVITTPLSYLASTSSIYLSGLKPIFCDIDYSLNIDHTKLEDCINEETLAVVFVHYSGNPTNIDKVKNICSKNKIFLIEDCAQAFGSTYKSDFSGTFGFSGCVSLHPLKNLSCAGDGGFVMTEDEGFFEYLNYARNHGHKSRDDVEFWSCNSRLDTLQAIITLSQFDWFENELKIRSEQYKTYKSFLPNKFFPILDIQSSHSLNWLVLLVENRNEVQKKLIEKNIESKIHYPKLIFEMKPFEKSDPNNFKNLNIAKLLSNKILSVPIGSHISNDVILRICELIKNFGE